MDDGRLPACFEQERGRLRAVAYRMLGSASEADDAVQETWLRLDGHDTSDVRNLAAWMTTALPRVCLTQLRTRSRRREEPLEGNGQGDGHDLGNRPEPAVGPGGDPEQEALLADSVGPALLVVLDTLTPAERVSFVLHDLFAVPFGEIGPMIGREPAAARRLASRARRRVKGGSPAPGGGAARQRRLVDAFLAAARGGDFEALLALLDPDVVLRADPAAGPTPAPVVLRGARTVAEGASAAARRARFTEPALVDGSVALVTVRQRRLALVLAFTVADGLITGIDVIADPDRLRVLDVVGLGD